MSEDNKIREVSFPKDWFAGPLKLADEEPPKRKRIRHPEPAPDESVTPPPDVRVTVVVEVGERSVSKSMSLSGSQTLEPLESVKFEGGLLASQAYHELEVARISRIAEAIAPRSESM